MTRTNEELEILNRYGITKFSQLTKEMYLDMQSRLSEMDPEVAKAIIAQIPDYTNFAGELISSVDSTISEAIKSDNDETALNYEMGNKVIEQLGKQLDRDDISSEERRHIIDQMVEVKRNQDAKETEKRKYHFELVSLKVLVAVALSALLALILGSGFTLNRSKGK